MRRTLLILALAVFVAMPARAQGLKIAFNQGRVSVDATAVPVRTILSEWAKLGGTKVVGAERITGAPLTLKLVDVPEAQALDVILRTVAGYMAAPRSTVAGASMYDRILIMATSASPAPAPAARPNSAIGPNPNNGTQRFIPPRPVRQEAQVEADEDEEDPNPPNPPVFTFPQPGQQPGFQQPGAFNGNGQPMMQGGAPYNVTSPGQPQTITINPAQPAGPTTPFGTTGASAPGMIQQPIVNPSQPASMPPGTRPPGVI